MVIRLIGANPLAEKNADILIYGPLDQIIAVLKQKNNLNISSAKWQPFCPGLNMLIHDMKMLCCLFIDIVLSFIVCFVFAYIGNNTVDGQ